MFFGEKMLFRTSSLKRENGRFVCEPSVLRCRSAEAAGTAKKSFSTDDFLLLPFLSRKKRKGGRFLFLKKRNKRHCGGGCPSGERRFSAYPVQNEKTDGSYVNRPFCAACRRKQQARRRKAFPQTSFFCFLFFLERKGRPQGKARAGRSCNRRAKTVYCFCRYST